MASIAITGAGGRLGSGFLSNPAWRDAHRLSPFSHAPGGSGDAHRAVEDLFEADTLARFDGILHLAWSTVPKTAEANPDRAGRVDLPLLESLLESAASAGERRERPMHFVFFSTGAVYGNSIGESGSTESDPPAPIGAYARGKREAEKRIEHFAETRKLRATILRVSNAWGFPIDAGPPQGVIPQLVRAALSGTPFEWWGADTEKDYLHIDDLSRAVLTVFEQRLPGCFNVATGRSHRLSEVIARVESVTGKPIRTTRAGGGAGENAIGWDVSRNRICPARFREATGWKPEISLEAGIARLADAMGS